MDVCTMRYTWAALCIAVLAMSVSVKSEEAPNALVTYELTMDITNRIYNSSLLKSNSSDYAILYKQVTDMLNSIYGCATCKTHVFYGNVSAMTFSNQTGTVLVKASLVFQSNKTNADEIKGLFMNATAADKEINGLKVNPNFTQVSVKSEEAPNALVTYELTMDITNRIYNSSLLKSNSSDYAILYKQVTDMLNSIYGCATCKTHVFYGNVSAMTFSNQTGTVLVKASLVFQSNKTNADEIKGLFMNATAADKEINGLKVNPNFTQVSVKSEEAPNALVTYELTMDITNRIYNSSLLKSNSSDYAILYKQVTDMLNSIYGCATCKTHVFYGNVSAMSFSNQTGTVLVKASLVFQSNKTNADEIKGLFMNATAADNEINGLKVNPNFTQVSVKSEEAPNALVTYELTMDITNRIYNSSLLKSNSSDYAILYKQVTDMLNSIYGCATCKTHVFYGNVSAMTFSNQTGTVLVKASLVFQSNKTNADEIKGLFMNATAADKEINGLKVNPNFTQVSVKSEEAPNALVTYELTMDITNRIYNSSLLKSNSSDYAILYKQVTDMLNSIYGCATCKTHVFYVNVSAMTFSNQTGTVLVKASLVFQSNKTNADEIKGLFMNATAGDKEINGLKVNPNFTQVSVKSEEAPNALVTYELTMDITNRIYNSSLLKSNSSDYAILYKQVTDMLNSIYGCATCKTHVFYVNVSAMTFSNQTGTVLVKASLVFQSNKTNADEIKELFMNATAGDKEINGLKVNPNFTQVIAPPSTPAPTVSSTSHTTKSPLLATTHYNTASSFNQSPIALTSILRYTVSFCLLYFLSYSF